MHRVRHEPIEQRVVERSAGVDRGVGELAQQVVEARRPFAAAQARGGRTVVDHVADPARVHVGVQAIDRLDHRFVDDLRVGVVVPRQHVDLGDHRCHVHPRSKGVQRGGVGCTRGAYLGADPPHRRVVDRVERVSPHPLPGQDHRADLVARGDFVVDLLQDFARGVVARRIGAAKLRLAACVQCLVHRANTAVADRLADRPGDRFHRVAERLRRIAAGGHVPAVEALDDAVNRSQQDAALAVDVRAVFHLQAGHEAERRTQRDRPAERVVGRLAVDVLLDREAGVDAGAFGFAALFVQPPHARAHTLGADPDHVDRLWKPFAARGQVPQQEAVAQAERRARLQRLEHAAVQRRLRRVRDQQDHQVARRDHVEHLAQRVLGGAEAGRFSLRPRRGSLAQSHDDGDVAARFRQRVAQVLRLRRSLTAPTDHPDLAYPGERGRELAELRAATAYDVLLAVGERDQLFVENLGLKIELHIIQPYQKRTRAHKPCARVANGPEDVIYYA